MRFEMIESYILKNSIFRIGEIYSVDGRSVTLIVDKDKNLSHILYKGDLVKNVSVGGYIKILKGFTKIIAKVESEYLKENKNVDKEYHHKSEEINRFLLVKLIGYFEGDKYYKGVKEVPLIGNVGLLMDNDEFSRIHRFAKEGEPTLKIGNLVSGDNVPIEIGIDKLFTSHIGIFGNTGSGKSYTLANLYKKLFDKVGDNEKFQQNAKFLLFDFNGEYSKDRIITASKHSYILSTRKANDRIPLCKKDILDPTLINILASATEKTQQPFIKRALRLYKNVQCKDAPLDYLKGILKRIVTNVVCMTDRVKAKLLLDYLEQILPSKYDNMGIEIGLQSDLNWHAKNNTFYLVDKQTNSQHYFNQTNEQKYIPNLDVYCAIGQYEEDENFIREFIRYLYIQLVEDVLNSRANNEHIIPAIKKLQAVIEDFDKIFLIDDAQDFWYGASFVVIDMNDVNVGMKKLIPLLLSTKLYNSHRSEKRNITSLNIIIDEAHNILSYESLRESETWKDFRLETFEEIIKEGRKFGVFLTIASQRPSDISATIISQLHNYFIHRLVNNKDLEMIEKAVSYLDKLSIESLPILPVGACVLSGIIADLPVIVQVDTLDKESQPKSENISLLDSWFDHKNK